MSVKAVVSGCGGEYGEEGADHWGKLLWRRWRLGSWMCACMCRCAGRMVLMIGRSLKGIKGEVYAVGSALTAYGDRG